jgi:hypothetical protein
MVLNFFRPSSAWLRRTGVAMVLGLALGLNLASCGGGGGAPVPVPVPVPAVITSQPASASVVAGATASFSVVATDATGYQWQVSTNSGANFVNVAGAISASTTTPATTMGDSGKQYRVVVTGAANSVASTAATLTVTPAPVAVAIISQPASTSTLAGRKASFSVVAIGTTPAYQWQRSTDGGVSFSPEAGATSATLALAAVPLAANSHQFRVAVSNSLGSINSSAATLSVNPMRLNDTGVTSAQCYVAGLNTLALCSSVAALALSPTQDGNFGRDADSATNGALDGKLGFSFTKLDAAGAALPASAAAWSCVQDNVTGLVWEVKTADGGLRDAAKLYTNFDSITDPQNNGVAPLPSQLAAANNTLGFITAVNAATLCGASDWRLPTPSELLGIVDYSVAAGTAGGTIDAAWFPNTQAGAYWTSSPYMPAPLLAYGWYVSFLFSDANDVNRVNGLHVRLVRTGQ